jgi:hypothetical protein
MPDRIFFAGILNLSYVLLGLASKRARFRRLDATDKQRRRQQSVCLSNWLLLGAWKACMGAETVHPLLTVIIHVVLP